MFFVKKHLQQISYVMAMSEWLSSPIILDGQRASQFLLNFLPLHRANFVQFCPIFVNDKSYFKELLDHLESLRKAVQIS